MLRRLATPALLVAMALTSALAILLLGRGELLGLAVGIGALLPTLIVPLNVLVNEHRLYLPVAGFVFAVTSMRGFGRIRGTGWIATLLLLGLAGLVVQRNQKLGEMSFLSGQTLMRKTP